MLSSDVITFLPTPMHAQTSQLQFDIFCNVVDNYGDIGVCWRLARQLASEHGVLVRLWVNDLNSFKPLCASIDPQRPEQFVRQIQVIHWAEEPSAYIPGDVVIEAFACRLPESFELAMSHRAPPPVWINLEYLSAEAWVEGCHARPSPHPKLLLNKYFFFPGFTFATGGLLREATLDEQRQRFLASPAEQARFWQQIGSPQPPPESLVVSLFAYEPSALTTLLSSWANSPQPVCCLAPATCTLACLEAFFGGPLRIGDVARIQNLEIRILPFVDQEDFDKLLWVSDINFVRGEDSFVRAQWAEKPFVWHIYPQDDGAHGVKLAAFLDLYCRDLSESARAATQELHLTWNGLDAPGCDGAASWATWLLMLEELRTHARNWTNFLKKQEDLCSSLVRFCRTKL